MLEKTYDAGVVEPDNAALVTRAREVDALRQDDRPTVPTTLELEMATNPFLRPSSPALRRRLDMAAASDVDVFARTRALKDAF